MSVGRLKHWSGRVAAVALGAGAAFGLFRPDPALAWGELGHRVVGDLAYEQLTPTAKAKVDGLLASAATLGEASCPVGSLSDAAAYLGCVDGIREFNGYRRLHYDAIPFCAPIPPKTDYCKNGLCATEALKRAIAVLRDPTAPTADRVLALEVASHLVGDLHQPLEMIDNRDDRGADIRVTLPGSNDRRLNLHDVWGETFVALAVGAPGIGLPYLRPLARAGARNWAQGDVDGWALESHRVAAQVIYARLPEPPACNRLPKAPETLDRAYVSAAVPLVREQLAKAGVRLALVLNDALR